MIANAVDADDPRIVRRPADEIRDDSDLGARLVTCAVPPLPAPLVAQALASGRRAAENEVAMPNDANPPTRPSGSTRETEAEDAPVPV